MRQTIQKIMLHLYNRRGQGMLEYLFVIMLIALTVISSLTPLGSILADKFTQFKAVVNGT